MTTGFGVAAVLGCLLGGGLASASTVPPSEPSDQGSMVTTTVLPGLQAAADGALLDLNDFPEGWLAIPEDEPTDRDREYRAAVAACAGGTGTDLLDLGGVSARTPDFVGPDDLQVEQTVTIVGQAVAEDFMARFGAPDVEECFGEAVRTNVAQMMENPDDPTDTLPPGVTIGDVTIERLDPNPIGDEVVGYRATVPIETPSVTVDSYIDIVAVRVGGSLSGLTFQSMFEPFPEDQLEYYLALAVARLPA
jgi:hypothetical protein